MLSLSACLLTAGAGTPPRAVDPGVRPGPPAAGGPVAAIDAQYFSNVRAAFEQEHSIAGDIEPGEGLGPRFNGTSCGGCHAYPAPGGSSPPRNPQLKMAIAHGARNRIPPFLKPAGPVLAVRSRIRAGDVLPLFTVTGRSDAYGCAEAQPDFSDTSKLSFRIPTPVYGAGLIDNIPAAAILANRAANLAAKQALGIAGKPNASPGGAIGKFGWKAQHYSLVRFAADAYKTEMGVSHDASDYAHPSPNKACYALYQAAYDDPNYSSSYDQDGEPSVFPFTEFMRFLKAPSPVPEFPGASSESIRNGRRLFDSVGCALCHTPSFHTGSASNLAALNDRDAQLYSDLLLHGMGDQLADGISQGAAGGDEFRTAPLWGLGQRIFFLHDGRTQDLPSAIEAHAGNRSEANATIQNFHALLTREQQDLLNFLRAL